MRSIDILSITLIGLFVKICQCQFSKNDKDYYKSLYSKTLEQSHDLQHVTYSVLGLKALGQNLEKHMSADLCQKVTKLYEKELTSVQALFFLSLLSENLEKCNIKAPHNSETYLNERIIDQKSVKTLYMVDKTIRSFRLISKKNEIITQMKEILIKDSSINNLAYYLKFADENWDIMDINDVKDKLQTILSQSDEVDGKYLQFDGGISITSLIINLLYKYSARFPDVKLLNEDKSLKFANYLLYHKSQINTKNAFFVYKAIKSISSSKVNILKLQEYVNAFIVPQFEIGQAVSPSKPIIKVSVSNIFGKSINEASPLQITVKFSSYSDPQNKDLMKTATFKPTSPPASTLITGKNTWYEINVMELNLPASHSYNMQFEVQPPAPDQIYYGLKSNKKIVNILKEVSIQDLTIQLVDKDRGDANVQKISVKENGKHTNTLDVGPQNKLIMNFVVKELPSNTDCLVQQAFVRFVHKASKHEAIYVAEPKGSSKVYEFDLNVGGKSGKDFDYFSGDYRVDLVVGDQFVANPIRWNIVDCHFTFPQSKEVKIADASKRFAKKPEIKHLFKVPEKRPPTIVSLVFSILTILPAFLMVALWCKLGVNFSKFQISLWSILFHSSLAAVFGLYGLFWLKLNMFQTLRYMTLLGPILFYTGNRLLYNLASQRK